MDFDAAVTAADKHSLMAQSRDAYSNNPLVRSVIQGRAMFATKNAWRYQPITSDAVWKETASRYIDKFSRVACVNGMDLATMIYQACVTIDRDGDFFIILTESKEGFPQLQPVPSNRIATRDNVETIGKGIYKGYKVISGVIVNGFNRPVAYNILADNQKDDRIIDAKNVIHIFDPETAESVRGIPLVSHTLTALADLEASKKAELTSMRMHSTVSMIEKLGAEDDTAGFLNEASADTPLYEEFRDGSVVVYRSQGSDLKSFESNRPSPEYQSFRARLIQEIVDSLGWSTSLMDGSDKSSVENRLNIRKAEVSIADRISLITPHIKRIIVWVLSKAIKAGELESNPDFFNMSFSRPPFLSADISRMESSTRENLILGITNLTQICEESGRNIEDHLAERYAEWALKNAARAKHGLAPLPDPDILP
jgi:hypothetical protein